YGEFLLDIAAERDPLWRTVTIACTATGGKGAPAEAMRRGEYTANALSALGVTARVLDGPTATAVLAASVDPYQYTDASCAPALLEPLLAWPGRLDVTLHIEPIPTADAANRLRRQRARLESSRRFDADKGRLGDPATDAAADDAADLADRLARGQSRLFRVGV